MAAAIALPTAPGDIAEEVEFVVMEVADRCGRSLDDLEASPLHMVLTTVRDLVVFLNHQPMLAATRALRSPPG